MVCNWGMEKMVNLRSGHGESVRQEELSTVDEGKQAGRWSCGHDAVPVLGNSVTCSATFLALQSADSAWHFVSFNRAELHPFPLVFPSGLWYSCILLSIHHDMASKAAPSRGADSKATAPPNQT